MTKKSNASEKLAKGAYEKFVRSVRLIGLGLRSCQCSLDRTNYFAVTNEKDAALTRINSEYRVTSSGTGHFDAEGVCSVVIEHKRKKTEVLSVSCSFQAHFHAKFDSDSGFPARFANSELRLILNPYFREFVSNITTRMAVRSILLPLSTDS